MRRIVITEEEKKDILDKYQDNTDPLVFTYLKRHYPTHSIESDFIKNKIKIMVDDKSHFVKNNKKYLVGKIYNDLRDEFSDRDDRILRRTIKKYLDLIIID